MHLVVPNRDFIESLTFATPDEGFDANHINVVVATSDTSGVMLDGTALDASDFSPIAGSEFSFARIPVDVGAHTVDSSSPVSVTVYGFSWSISYSHVAGQKFRADETTSAYENRFSQPTSRTDGNGNTSEFEIDPDNGNTNSIKWSDGTTTDFQYTGSGQVELITDQLGRITEYEYDQFGRNTKITFAKGTSKQVEQSFEFDAAGNQTAFINENEDRTEFEYDALNRLTMTRDALGFVTTFDYDDAGNLIESEDAAGNMVRNNYDNINRLVFSADGLGNETLYAYDRADNLIQTTDPVGNVTRNIYDRRDRLARTIDPDGGSARFTYDLNDNMLSLTDPVNNRTQFVYDSQERLIREIDPLGAATNYRYDSADNMVRKIDRIGRETVYQYDSLNRLISEDWNGGAVDNLISFERAIHRHYC